VVLEWSAVAAAGIGGVRPLKPADESLQNLEVHARRHENRNRKILQRLIGGNHRDRASSLQDFDSLGVMEGMKKAVGREFVVIGRDGYAFRVIERGAELDIPWEGYRGCGGGWSPEWYAERHKLPVSRDQALWRRLRGLPAES
jgi:hypothetical protein